MGMIPGKSQAKRKGGNEKPRCEPVRMGLKAMVSNEDVAGRVALKIDMEEVIAKMPKKQRQVIGLLRQGYSHKEIAEIQRIGLDAFMEDVLEPIQKRMRKFLPI